MNDLVELPDKRHQLIEAASVDAVLERLAVIQDLMRRAMSPSIDFGQIPGTNSKPTLLKPGAEKLCVMFRLVPRYATQQTIQGRHLTVGTVCTISDLAGHVLGEASAICSTKESKYAYRKAERTCPKCGKAAIIKGKEEYGGGWLCWKKKDGCGAQWPDAAPEIASQTVGRVDNDDLEDSYNTVIRIAEKRALIAAVRLVTGSSALFDEESPDYESHIEQPPKKEEPASAAQPANGKGGISKQQWDQILTLVPARAGHDLLCGRFGVKRGSGIPAERFEEALAFANLIHAAGPSEKLSSALCDRYQVRSLSDLPASELQAALDFINAPQGPDPF